MMVSRFIIRGKKSKIGTPIKKSNNKMFLAINKKNRSFN